MNFVLIWDWFPQNSSGERVYSTHIQPRCNTHLRPLLIEAAWTAIRRCPVLLAYYRKHAGKNNKKAIVKVAKKLVLIAKAVALKKEVNLSSESRGLPGPG